MALDEEIDLRYGHQYHRIMLAPPVDLRTWVQHIISWQIFMGLWLVQHDVILLIIFGYSYPLKRVCIYYPSVTFMFLVFIQDEMGGGIASGDDRVSVIIPCHDTGVMTPTLPARREELMSEHTIPLNRPCEVPAGSPTPQDDYDWVVVEPICGH